MVLPKINFIVSKIENKQEYFRFAEKKIVNDRIEPWLKNHVESSRDYYRVNFPETFNVIKYNADHFEARWPEINKRNIAAKNKFIELWKPIEKDVLRDIQDIFLQWKLRNINVYFCDAILCNYSQPNGIWMLPIYGSMDCIDILIHELMHSNFYSRGKRSKFEQEWDDGLTERDIPVNHACIYLAGDYLAKKYKVYKKIDMKIMQKIDPETFIEMNKLKPEFDKYLRSRDKNYIKWYKSNIN